MLVSALVGIILGWNNIFKIEVGLAAASEFVAVITPNIEILSWVSRIGMGMAASLIIPSVLALVAQEFTGAQRKIAFGVISGFAALATIVPILFGIITDYFGFRATFAVLSILFFIYFVSSVILPKSEH